MGVPSLRDCSLAQLDRLSDYMPAEAARRCRFIVEENDRVLRLAQALLAGRRDEIAMLCAESFHGATELYEIVIPPMKTMVDAMLAAPGAIGARQAGAGFGGCMVAFVDSRCVAAFSRAVCSAYSRAADIEPAVYPVEPAGGAGLLEVTSIEVAL